MSGLDAVREALHLVAAMLAWPVLAGLLIALGVTAHALGAFLHELWLRRIGRFADNARVLRALSDAADDASGREPVELRLERVLQDEELYRSRRLLNVRMMVRVGPALGLMGTLIPMAYALQGLAEGNLPALAGNLVTAFAATVVGLAVSVVAYLLAAGYERWLRSDSKTWSFAAESLLLQAAGAGAR